MKSFVKIISLVLILLAAAIFASCGSDGVVVELGGKKIYAGTPFPAVSTQSANGETKITVKNRSSSDVSFIIYTKSDKPRTELYCKAGEKATAYAVFEKTDCAVDGIATVGDSVVAYVFTQDGLTAASEDANNIFLLNDISINGDLTLGRPVKIYTSSNTLNVGGDIYLSSDEEGSFELEGDITARLLLADAPLCDIIVPDGIATDSNIKRIAAKTLNGASLDSTRIVSSEIELRSLLSENAYPALRAGSTVVLRGFEVTEAHKICVPVSLYFENMAISAPVTVETEIRGTVKIKGTAKCQYIVINAPQCDIEWEDSGYTVFDAAEKYDALTFNGISLSSYALGGKKEQMLDISLDMGKNMTCEAVWQRTAPYTYTAILTSPVAPSALDGVQPKITAEGEGAAVVYDSFCQSGEGVDLLCANGVSFTLGGARYRLITKSQCRLPVVVIDTGGAAIDSKENYIPATVSVESDFSVDGMPSLDTCEVSIAGRGNTTWRWSAKKPYKLKFDQKTSVLGMSAANNWVLLANFADKSLIRSYVALEAAKVLDKMDCYATQYPVDVFVGGEYVGVYTMGEKVECGEGRAYVHSNGASTDCGFLLELNGADDDEEGISVLNKTPIGSMKVVYPQTWLNSQQSEYISNYITSVSNAITTTNDPSQYIDMESFADFILMLELSYNSDGCFRRSVFFAKDAGGRLRVSQVWDFDLAFGNSFADGDWGEWMTLSDNNYVNTRWSKPLMSGKKFLDVLRQRWEEKGDKLVSAALNAVDYGEYLTAPSAAANFKKWDIMYLYVGMEPEENYQHHTFEDQVEYLRQFIINRAAVIDERLGAVHGYQQ